MVVTGETVVWSHQWKLITFVEIVFNSISLIYSSNHGPWFVVIGPTAIVGTTSALVFSTLDVLTLTFICFSHTGIGQYIKQNECKSVRTRCILHDPLHQTWNAEGSDVCLWEGDVKDHKLPNLNRQKRCGIHIVTFQHILTPKWFIIVKHLYL